MYASKLSRRIGIFFCSFLTTTAIICGFVFFRNLNKAFLSKYSLLAVGSSIGFCSYLVVFTSQTQYLQLMNNMFSIFWPLQNLSRENFNHITQITQLVKYFAYITVFMSFVSSTAGLPWFGDEYDIMLPVKMYTDILGTWATPFLVIYYVSVYHIGFTIICNSFVLIHVSLHFKFQYFLLSKHLEQLQNEPELLNVTTRN
ncbi:hypothetical protein BDFB_012032 [Asbolus verrucosus]|uniref:7tm 6 domain containing protein n=1 Tax=Asbolus verrucosus TaxID=1661398 RepID=A0A482VM94_ASBVE|nr:hypothetical protein BDFB_012032 [Asbolus verrucosus]